MGRTIVVFGETGVGKSSLINLLSSQKVATTSDAAKGCTFTSTKYHLSNGDIIYDTAGLNETQEGTVTAAAALGNLAKLIKSLEGGINLLIFVIRKGRITDIMKKNYDLFVKGICNEKVPVILIITNCEMGKELGDWYNKNKDYFDTNGLLCAEVVSGCFTQDLDSYDESLHPLLIKRFDQTKEKMKTILGPEKYQESFKFGTWVSWFKTAFGRIWNTVAKFYNLPQISLWNEMKLILIRLFGYSEEVATEVSNEIVDATN